MTRHQFYFGWACWTFPVVLPVVIFLVLKSSAKWASPCLWASWFCQLVYLILRPYLSSKDIGRLRYGQSVLESVMLYPLAHNTQDSFRHVTGRINYTTKSLSRFFLTFCRKIGPLP